MLIVSFQRPLGLDLFERESAQRKQILKILKTFVQSGIYNTTTIIVKKN